MSKADGDNAVSGRDRRIWSVIRESLIRWNTLIYHKSYPPNITAKIPEFHMFFIPVDATYRYEITQFIEKELSDLRREPVDMGMTDGTVFPGSSMTIYAITENEPHVDAEVLKKYCKSLMTDWLQKIKENKKSSPE